jgi:hypothetical protein
MPLLLDSARSLIPDLIARRPALPPIQSSRDRRTLISGGDSAPTSSGRRTHLIKRELGPRLLPRGQPTDRHGDDACCTHRSSDFHIRPREDMPGAPRRGRKGTSLISRDNPHRPVGRGLPARSGKADAPNSPFAQFPSASPSSSRSSPHSSPSPPLGLRLRPRPRPRIGLRRGLRFRLGLRLWSLPGSPGPGKTNAPQGLCHGH